MTLWFCVYSEHVNLRLNIYRLGQASSFYLVFPHSDICTFNTVIIVSCAICVFTFSRSFKANFLYGEKTLWCTCLTICLDNCKESLFLSGDKCLRGFKAITS